MSSPSSNLWKNKKMRPIVVPFRICYRQWQLVNNHWTRTTLNNDITGKSPRCILIMHLYKQLQIARFGLQGAPIANLHCFVQSRVRASCQLFNRYIICALLKKLRNILQVFAVIIFLVNVPVLSTIWYILVMNCKFAINLSSTTSRT